MRTLGAPRVAHVLRKLDGGAWGGTESHVAEIAPRLAELGIGGEVHAPALRADGAVTSLGGLPVSRFSSFCPFAGPRAARQALVANAGNIASFELPLRMFESRAQLAHLHTAGRIGGAARTAMRWTNRPYVVSLHGPVLAGTDFLAPQVERMHAEVVDLGRPLGWLFGARRVLDDAARVIAFNDAEVEALRGRIGDRAVRMDHGVDAARLGAGSAARARARIPELGDAPVVLVLGRLSVQKDQVTAVRAFAAGAPRDHRLVLAGAETDPGYTSRVLAEAGALGVRDRVHMLGNVPREEVPDLLALSNVVLAPSRHEAFGLMALEAWAAGRPILFARRHGLLDVAERFARWGGEGASELASRFLVPADADARAWGAALRALAADGATRAGIGAAGQRLVDARFTWARVAGELATVYLSVLEEQVRPRSRAS